MIRISQGERDASARATHLEAATRKFLVTTNERKQMSTKTNFKRIALVAVAALGLGLLSSVPSQAASQVTLTVADGTSSLSRSDSTTAASITLAALMDQGDSITIQVVMKSSPVGTLPITLIHRLDSNTPQAATNILTIDTSAVAAGAPAANTAAALNTLEIRDTVSVVAANRTQTNMVRVFKSSANTGFVSQAFGLQLDTATARVSGTYTYTVIAKVYNVNATTGGVASVASSRLPELTIERDVSITVAAASTLSTTPSAVTSFVDIRSAAQATGASDSADDAITGVSTAGTAVGYLYIGNRNAANGNTTAQDSITVTVTGAGQVCATSAPATGSPSATSCGTNIRVSAVGDYQFVVQGNGTAGSSLMTVTSSVAGWTVTKSATFYSVAAKTLTATVAHPLARVGTNAGIIRVTGVDANGVAWMGTPSIYASSAADALVGGSTTPAACSAYSVTLGYAECSISTLTTGTAKFKVIDAATVAAATATSNEVTITVSNAVPATVRLSFDKATYAPNERARIYVTPLDSAGKELQQITADLLATGGITVNGAISFTGSTTTADSLTATSITTSASTSATSGARAGAMVYTVYMPSAGGTVTLSATGGTGLPVAGRVAVTASATVTDSGAAALAAVNALATTVASLRTLITTLTNLVLKIQKKVRA